MHRVVDQPCCGLALFGLDGADGLVAEGVCELFNGATNETEDMVVFAVCDGGATDAGWGKAFGVALVDARTEARHGGGGEVGVGG